MHIFRADLMRSFLNKLYLFCGYLSGVFLIGILLSIIWQVIARWLGRTADASELAGMCLAASTFFGLAYTFREGGHVRINLLVSRMPKRSQHGLELFNCSVGLTVIAVTSWNIWLLVLQSWEFNDISPGLLAMPFWIPQVGVAFGLSILSVALLDEIIWLLQGRRPRYEAEEALNDVPVA